MATHDLKTWPEPFQAILDGRKRYEIRENDRGFTVGDGLFLREFRIDVGQGVLSDGAYTGRTCLVYVTYMTRGGEWGLPPTLCVMSIAKETKP